jgi:hypothetical protein
MFTPPSTGPNSAQPGDLQFQRAEFGQQPPASQCVVCKTPIADSYYQVNGRMACPGCAQQIQTLKQPEGGGMFWRAALYGLGAAIAGSILYAVVSLTGFQFSIVAIVVGVMVGKAIRYVTKSRGTRAYQVLAVALTYGAIASSEIPLLLKQAAQHRAAPAQAASNVATPKPAPSLARLSLGIAMLIGISLVLPFIYVAHDFAGGAINLVIIGIGLMQAWRITRPVNFSVMGPYSLTQRASG